MRYIFAILFALASPITFSKTEAFTLSNGMKVVVREDHRAPVVVSMVWYNVGSADEIGGSTGLAHALEHLMFKGTPNYPIGMFSKTISTLGGQENAFTNTDYTAYFEKLAAKHLAKSFELEADRMQNLLFDSKEFDKEIKVIQEERRLRTDDNPHALAYERFNATAYLRSPYHHPVIGWMSDLEQMTVGDTKSWFEHYYAPNNATLVVVGDVNPEEVHQLAQKYFGKIKPKSIPQRKAQAEPPQLGKKTVVITAAAKIPMLMMGYTVPTIVTANEKDRLDPYALELIAGILDAGDTGRFVRQLVREQQIASDTDILYTPYARYQTQFVLYGIPSQSHTIKELQEGFLQELKKLKEEKISEKELARIKTQLIAQKTYERDSIFGQAMEIGVLETLGLGWQTAEQYIEHIQQVTPEDIQKTAKKYFVENNLTEATLIPESPQHQPS